MAVITPGFFEFVQLKLCRSTVTFYCWFPVSVFTLATLSEIIITSFHAPLLSHFLFCVFSLILYMRCSTGQSFRTNVGVCKGDLCERRAQTSYLFFLSLDVYDVSEHRYSLYGHLSLSVQALSTEAQLAMLTHLTTGTERELKTLQQLLQTGSTEKQHHGPKGNTRA